MKKIILLIPALSTMNNLFAQFQTASNPPKYGNSSTGVHLTNCDMLTGAASPLTNIRISAIVCDGSNPSLLAEAYNTSTNTIIHASTSNLFYSDAVLPDVCLVSRGSTVWALVLYRTFAQQLVCLETFECKMEAILFYH